MLQVTTIIFHYENMWESCKGNQQQGATKMEISRIDYIFIDCSGTTSLMLVAENMCGT